MDLGDHRGAVHGVVNYGGSGRDGAVHCVVMNRLGEAAVSAVMHRGLGGTNIVSCGVRHGGQGRACRADWAGLDGGGADPGDRGHQGASSHAQTRPSHPGHGGGDGGDKSAGLRGEASGPGHNPGSRDKAT